MKRFILVDEDTEYLSSIKLYKGKKYIPESFIPILLQYYNLIPVIKFNFVHFMVKTTIKCLLEMPIINWSYNRPQVLKKYQESSCYLFLNKFDVLAQYI